MTGRPSHIDSQRPPGQLWDQGHLANPHQADDKAQRVRTMFDRIAPTYERVNSLTSGRRDRYWRKQMVRLAQVVPGDIMLDVASGTGDVARTFASARPRPRHIVGVDFSAGMLAHAQSRPIERGHYLQADGLALPLADASVTLVTCAFGIRNFQNLAKGLAQMHRVLAPGGRAVILEFRLPTLPILRQGYGFYFQRVLPWLAQRISGDRTGAYRYLPQSVVHFTPAAKIVDLLTDVGFGQVRIRRLSLGIVQIFVARKPEQ